MAAYGEFAWFYDEFNGEADYQALFDYVHGELEANGVAGGLLADLGCGTGDLTLMLSQAGYDVIGIDRSPEMLSVFREKADELGLSGKVLLLCQDILSMETVRAALDRYGFTLVKVSDGEDFGPVRPDSQRWIFTAVKRYTQEETV